MSLQFIVQCVNKMVLSAVNSFLRHGYVILMFKNMNTFLAYILKYMHTQVNTCCLDVPYVYCASFHRYQQVQERSSSTAQVEHIPNHFDGGQEMDL